MNTRINSLTEGTISTADWFPIDGPNGTKKLSTGLIAASIGNAAAEYDSTDTYNEGDYCTHDGVFYVCNDDSVTGAWDATKWDETTTADGIAQLKEEKADKDEISNRNYLDNPFFTINQRGATTYTVGAYGVDRWKLVSGTATVSGSQITLNGTLRQILELPLGTNNFKCSVLCASGTATATYDDSTKYFDITSSGGVIKCAKLELGSVSTLAIDTAPNYAEELLKCQRYYFSISSITDEFAYTTGDPDVVKIIIPLATKFRTEPTILNLTLYEYRTSGSSTNVAVSSYFVSTLLKTQIILTAVCSNSFTLYTFGYATRFDCSLSADL